MIRNYPNVLRPTLLAMTIAIAGCSPHDSSVTGVVTFDGKPLENGMVTFHPVGSGALAYARTGTDGRFELRTGSQAGLKPGEYQITVAASGPIPAATATNREPIAPLITPLKYNNKETSGFKHSVVPGKNDVNLELQAN